MRSVPGEDTCLIVANPDGTGEQILYFGKHPQMLSSPAWSPDGKVIACVRSDSWFQADVISVELSGAATKQLTYGGWIAIVEIAWLKDGTGLVISARQREVPYRSQLWILSYPEGGASRITNDLDSYSSLSLAAETDLILSMQHESLSNVWVTSLAGTTVGQQLTSGDRGSLGGVARAKDGTILYVTRLTSGDREGVGGVAWAKDDTILYVTRAGGNYDIWSMDSGGGNKKQLTSGAGWNLWPSASSDGRYVVFSSNRTGQFTVWRMNADGTDQRQLVGHESVYPHVSHDGRVVTYMRRSADRYAFWQVSIEGGYAVELPSNEAHSRPAISPDGQAAAYFLAEGQGAKLVVTSLDGSYQRKEFPCLVNINSPGIIGPPSTSLIFNTYHIRWTPDGRTVTYKFSGMISEETIWAQSLDGGPPQRLAYFKCAELLSFDWSQDGKKIAAACGDYKSNFVLISSFR